MHKTNACAIFVPDELVIEYMNHPTLAKQVHTESFAFASLGNAYLLKTTHYDKILDWVIYDNCLLKYDSIMHIIYNIESTTEYTNTTLRILIKLLWRVSITEIKSYISPEKLYSIIEKCVMSINNFNLMDVLVAKCSGGGLGKAACKCKDTKLIMDNSKYSSNCEIIEYNSKITELLLTYTVVPIIKEIIEYMIQCQCVVIEPERFF